MVTAWKITRMLFNNGEVSLNFSLKMCIATNATNYVMWTSAQKLKTELISDLYIQYEEWSRPKSHLSMLSRDAELLQQLVFCKPSSSLRLSFFFIDGSVELHSAVQLCLYLLSTTLVCCVDPAALTSMLRQPPEAVYPTREAPFF